ncbi:MAG: GGDEF domain-containing protein [Burkholderiales bacterium]
MRVPIAHIREWIVGRHPDQQLRASQTFLVLMMQVVFAGVQHAEVMLGLIDFSVSWPLTVFGVGSAAFFYVFVRSGLNLRFKRGRSLPLSQTFCALLCLSWSYGITGPARGAILLIIASVIMFGMFSLSATQLKQLTALTLSMLGAVMVLACWRDAGRYDPRVEAVHFLFATAVLSMVAILAARIGGLKRSLQDQKKELGTALERIQLLATRDDLTGLLNRRAVLDRLGLELRDRDLNRPRLSVALIDLDHFKRVNDGLGHAAGDAVLRRFAEIGSLEVRGSDVLARWGGEEFLLMMPSSSAQSAMQVLNRIRCRLLDTSLDDIQPGLRITFSAGVAECSDRADIERAVERADMAMYDAKSAGRDRTHLANNTAPLGVGTECDGFAALPIKTHL